MALFGDRYKKLIKSNPNKKSSFNTNPGIELGLLKTNNPYTELINRWDFTKAIPFAPFVGREPEIPMMDTYYVDNGYVEDGYVEVKQVPIL
jgi:hypothetical protein